MCYVLGQCVMYMVKVLFSGSVCYILGHCVMYMVKVLFSGSVCYVEGQCKRCWIRVLCIRIGSVFCVDSRCAEFKANYTSVVQPLPFPPIPGIFTQDKNYIM